MTLNSSTLHLVAKVDQIVDDQPIQVKVGNLILALYRVREKIYATAGICTHQHAFMAQGYQEEDEIECPLHQARFNICTGKALTAPANQDLAVYPVQVDGDNVYVEITS
ncbi:MAG: non-heme iron oxygenase ferredoxin subunit [Dongiaceae bacterium]